MLKSFLGRAGIVGDLFRFLRKEKMWWLVPFIAVLVLLGILMIFAQSSPAAPFIYTLF